MTTLRYKNPTMQKWELVGVSGGGGSGSQVTSSEVTQAITDILTELNQPDATE